MNAQEYNLNIRPGYGYSQTVKVSQDDIGRPLEFHLYDGMDLLSITVGSVITIHATKPSGLGFTETCTWSGSTASISTTESMTQESGAFPAELVITSGGDVLGTANFTFCVERSPHQTGTTDGVAEDLQDIYEQLDDLKDDIENIDGISDDVKTALLQIAAKAVYVDDGGQQYYQDLYDALYPEEPPATLVSISAVYTQSGTVYDTDTLNSLKTDLVVTALYSDSTTATVTAYTLSGTLTAGTSTITVTYSGKTTTFNVTVTHFIPGWLYHFNQSLASSGEKDFELVGTQEYDTGLFDKYCYKHFIPTPGTSSSDTQYGLKALALTDPPDFNGNFTISFWMATQANYYCHPVSYSKYGNASEPSSSNRYFSNLTAVATGWTVSQSGASNKYAGITIYGNTSNRYTVLTMHSADLTKSGQLQIKMPSTVDTKEWHHYAFTRKDTTLYFFFDGVLTATATTAITTVYSAAQIGISTNFTQTEESADVIQQMPNGEKLQDLYIAEFCKWETDFDPTAIEY